MSLVLALCHGCHVTRDIDMNTRLCVDCKNEGKAPFELKVGPEEENENEGDEEEVDDESSEEEEESEEEECSCECEVCGKGLPDEDAMISVSTELTPLGWPGLPENTAFVCSPACARAYIADNWSGGVITL